MKKPSARAPKPRNGHLAVALFRRAGAHQKTTKALRRESRVALRKQVCADPRQASPSSGSLPRVSGIVI